MKHEWKLRHNGRSLRAPKKHDANARTKYEVEIVDRVLQLDMQLVFDDLGMVATATRHNTVVAPGASAPASLPIGNSAFSAL